jgi:hypothetical protein
MWLGCLGIGNDVMPTFRADGQQCFRSLEGCFALLCPLAAKASCGFEVCNWEEAKQIRAE